MSFRKISLALLVCTSSVLASQHDHSHHRKMELVRRDDIEDCSKGLVDDLWQRVPAGVAAVVCVRDHQNWIVTDKSPEAQIDAGWHECSEKGFLGVKHKYQFQCFYLNKWNTFIHYSDGGYRNLALRYDSKCCTWTDSELELSCYSKH